MIVLVGFMGAGKSTVGRLFAEAVRLPFTDSDEMVAERAGLSISEIFSGSGEGLFRILERDAILEALDRGEGVLALGGGALADPGTRAALTGHTAVYLKASLRDAMARVGTDLDRPMLAMDPEGLYRDRTHLYEAVADRTIDTDILTPEEVVERLIDLVVIDLAKAEVHRVVVDTAGGRYEVQVGRGLKDDLAARLPELPGAEKAFVVTHPNLAALAEGPLRSLDEAGFEADVAFVPEGEASKSLDVAGALYDWLARSHAHRADLLVGVGGGVVCDLTGFVASTYARGLPVALVPTSLLAQVDAGVGGKTGVNLPHGKNLVGTFHQPCAVVCDVDVLAGLPVAELRSGMAEVAKYGFIAEPGLLPLLEENARSILAGDPDLLLAIVGRSVEIKANIVAADEREQGVRAHLNYGHTFAHAIEQVAGLGVDGDEDARRAAPPPGVRHGEAVALGMMSAAYLSAELGRLDAGAVETHRRVLDAVGLPVKASLGVDELEPAWQLDKKYRQGVRFVLLNEIGVPEAGVEAPREAVARALERMS
ncbi:MAG: 3-dehydroquinate synthase [Actinobacteria bacterium]|nr:3-dehydroquinate synthase [Actinomycetota bacterium]